MAVKAATQNEAKYDADFYAWTEETARLPRERRFDEIAADVLAEQIEDMRKRENREARLRMNRLVSHLLKWEYRRVRPTRASRSRRDRVRGAAPGYGSPGAAAGA